MILVVGRIFILAVSPAPIVDLRSRSTKCLKARVANTKLKLDDSIYPASTFQVGIGFLHCNTAGLSIFLNDTNLFSNENIMSLKTAVGRKTGSTRQVATPIPANTPKRGSNQTMKAASPLAGGTVIVHKGSAFNRKMLKAITFAKLVNTPIGVQETIDVIRATLPPTVVNEAMDFLSAPRNEVLAALRIPVSSFHRKLTTNQALSPEETNG